MSKQKKVFVLLPDGVGLRNFAFTNFPEIAKENNLDLVYWNTTDFKLQELLDLEEVKITEAKSHPLSDIYKRAKTRIEIKSFYKMTGNSAFLSYLFPQSYKSVKQTFKNVLVNVITVLFRSENGQKKIRRTIAKYEKKTPYYGKCIEQLKKNAPDFVFCTNQRPILAAAPILAARELNIPTATFIFSWDNLPKGTMVVDTDYYFVWSEHMKEELLTYYPYIQENQIIITGTPQFEPYYAEIGKKERAAFFEENGLDPHKKYVCFSGDDEVTSPFDPQYLKDIAEAITILNNEGGNFGIIFRKCPVDFSGRYDSVLSEYDQVIVSLDPKWERVGKEWNTVMPQKEDITFLTNTVKYSELVINIGSTMAFDAYANNIPCMYLNYNSDKGDTAVWDIHKLYKFIHFQSMPSKDVVIWANHKNDLTKLLKDVLLHNEAIPVDMEPWFDKITASPKNESSKRIVQAIHRIIA